MSGPNLLAICHTAKLSKESAASSVCMNGDMIFRSWRGGPSQTPLHLSKSQCISIKALSANTFLIYTGVTCPRTQAHTRSVIHAKGNPNYLLSNHQRIKQKMSFLAYDIFWHSFPKIFPILQWQKILDFKIFLQYKVDKKPLWLTLKYRMVQQFWIKQTWDWSLKVFHNYEIINFLVNKIASKLYFFSCEKIKHSRKTCFGFEEYSFSDIKILLKINFWQDHQNRALQSKIQIESELQVTRSFSHNKICALQWHFGKSEHNPPGKCFCHLYFLFNVWKNVHFHLIAI